MAATATASPATAERASPVAAAPAGATANGVGGKNASLAAMLRECADRVERNEFHPVLYQALALLHAYTGEKAGAPVAPAGGPPAATPARRAGSDERRAGSSDGRESGVAGTAAAAIGTGIPSSVFDSEASAEFENNPSKSSSPKEGGSGRHIGGGSSGVFGFKAKDIGNLGKEMGKDINKLGKKFSKVAGFVTTHDARQESTKNATELRAEVESGGGAGEKSGVGAGASAGTGSGIRDGNEEWCEECFTVGCQRHGKNADPQAAAAVEPVATKPQPAARAATPPKASATGGGQAASQQQQQKQAARDPNRPMGKPCFQRPINPNSNLIANGWIEQQRRSKLRVVWKDILASLVEGRRPGEETTLWIQRQVTNASTGRAELEALHQIPMKWLEDVTYLDFYGDHRFALKIYNVTDEFQFRTTDGESAQNWVITLRSARDASLRANQAAAGNGKEGRSGVDGWDSTNLHQTPSYVSEEGVEVQRDQTPDETAVAQTQQRAQNDQKRLTIKELRAIAHGVGIDTRGMERSDLERIAHRHGRGGGAPGAVLSSGNATADAAAEHVQWQQKQAAEAAARADAVRKLQVEAERKRQEQEAAAARAAAERASEEKRQQEVARQALEEKRRQEAAAAAAAAEAERKRLEAEAEHRRRQEELQRQEDIRRRQAFAEKQAAEHKRRMEEEEQRKRAAEEAQRRQEEELRKRQQQQWQQQQQQWQQQQAQQQAQHKAQQQAQQQQWQQWHAQQQAQQQQRPQPQPAAPPPPPPPPPRGQLNTKYAKAMEQSEEAEQAAITRIKREILINWALQPPMYQMLRPIDQLVTTVHTAFPPAHGVESHAYFQKWKPIARDDLILSGAMGNTPSEDKLKKAVRKIRFFLHPDKLPRDLNAEQSFMVKMLWDVTSDSWEEFCKQREELDWIRG